MPTLSADKLAFLLKQRQCQGHHCHTKSSGCSANVSVFIVELCMVIPKCGHYDPIPSWIKEDSSYIRYTVMSSFLLSETKPRLEATLPNSYCLIFSVCSKSPHKSPRKSYLPSLSVIPFLIVSSTSSNTLVPNHSTETSILTSDCFAKSNGQISVLLLLNLSTAFDTLCPSFLKWPSSLNWQLIFHPFSSFSPSHVSWTIPLHLCYLLTLEVSPSWA